MNLRCCFLLAVVGFASPSPSRAQTPAPTPGNTTDVAAGLDRLDAWLGAGANGDRWRRHLHVAQLRAELQKGAAADPAMVAAAAERFSAPTPGLNLPKFVAVRDALRRWNAALRERLADDLPAMAQAAQADHMPITDAQYAAVRGELRTRAAALLAALGGDSQLARGWRKYLKWDQLEPHLAENAEVDRRSLTNLGAVLQRLRTNEPGLELPVFVDLAKAIEEYRALASWTTAAKSRDSRAAYETLLGSIGEELKRHLEKPTTETTWQVGRVLGVVDGLGLSPDFVAAVRRHFVKSNIEATVSASFIERMPERRRDEVRPVRDCILGTTIIGSALTATEVEYSLEQSPRTVALAVHLDGTAQSRNNGYNGPVRIKTSGLTTYSAVSRLSISDEEFVASPVVAAVDTNTHIQSINKTGGRFGAKLIEKVAWRRAGEQKGQAERISSEHTRQRVVREFADTVARDLGDLRRRYELEVQAPLTRRGIRPDYLLMRSDPSAAFIETVLAARNQLGADRDPPQADPESDLILQVHESAVNNYLVLALASARISQETADVAPALQGDVPNWIKGLSITNPKLAAAAATGAEIVEEAQETIEEVVEGQADERPAGAPTAPPFKPYSITLNGEAPIGVRFADGKLVIRIRASRLASDDAEYLNWDFIVTYEIVHEDDHIVLKRVGDIEVFPTGFDPAWDKQLTAQQSGFRSTLAKNMNARAQAGQSFPNEIPIEPIRTTRFGTLLMQQMAAEEGWLTLGWVLAPTASPQPLVPPRPGTRLVPRDAAG